MAAYVIIIRDRTTDPARYASQLEKYTAQAMKGPPPQVDVVSGRQSNFRVLEGGDAENVAILRFRDYRAALEWYRSEWYQQALPYRKSVAEYTAFVVEADD